ncbi:MAG: hypothetical protein C4316_06295 [Chloroflexota bacterium]
MARLVLVRHGQTDWNLQRRIQGKTDIPLGEAGRRQAAALAKLLAAEPVAAVYASPLRREPPRLSPGPTASRSGWFRSFGSWTRASWRA